MRYSMQILLLVTDDARMPLMHTGGPTFDFDHAGAAYSLHRAGDRLEVDATTIDAALEVAFRVANIGDPTIDPRWERTYRHRDRARSLSVGDLVDVNAETAYQVLPLGFAEITPAMRARVPDLLCDRCWADVAAERVTTHQRSARRDSRRGRWGR